MPRCRATRTLGHWWEWVGRDEGKRQKTEDRRQRQRQTRVEPTAVPRDTESINDAGT